MEPWMWIIAALWLAAIVVVMGAIRLGAALDDMQEIIRQDERERAALGRAAARAATDNVVPIRPDTA